MKRNAGRLTRLLVAVVIAVGTMACGSSFQVVTPPGFVELPDQEPDYDFRAANADGVVIAVRHIEPESKGDLAFWVKAVENRLRNQGGYALLSEKDVKTRQGLSGKRLVFGHDDKKGDPMRYELVIFVTEDHEIYLLEFGGPAAELDKLAPRLDWIIENFQVT